MFVLERIDAWPQLLMVFRYRVDHWQRSLNSQTLANKFLNEDVE